MVLLREMSKPRHETWAKNLWQVYYDELIQAGFSEATAKANSAPDDSIEFGKVKPGNFILEVVHEHLAVGNVWLVQKDSEWWIYDIEIDEPMRGQGLGRQTMHAIEEFAKANGATKLNLSVFGFNETAQKLYLSEGFQVARIQMLKNL